MDEFFTVSFIQLIFIENLIYVECCFVSRDIVVNKTVKNLYLPGLRNLWDETYNIEKFNKQTIYYIKRWLTFWRKIKLVDRNSWQPQASLKTMFGPGFRKEIGKPHKYLRKKHFRQKGEQIQRWEPSWQAQRTANEILNAVTVADDTRVRVLQTEARKDKVQETEDVVGLVGTPTPKLLCCMRSELDSMDITGGFSAKKWCVFTYVLEESCSLLYWQEIRGLWRKPRVQFKGNFNENIFPHVTYK